jgi:hypothetical protein
MSNLAALQAQIAHLQGLAAPVSIVPTPQIDIMAQVKELIKETLNSELADIRKLIEVNMPKTETKKEKTILEVIGLSLTQEEQMWLSSMPVQKHIPIFLEETAGSDCIKLFVSELKASYDKKS